MKRIVMAMTVAAAIVVALFACKVGEMIRGTQETPDDGAVAQTYTYDTEQYEGKEEEGFKSAQHDPLSTFSIDVDTASYANVRRFLTTDQLPPVDAVRIEELVNYFSYRYPEPAEGEPFSVTTALADCPWKAGHLLLQVGLKGKEVAVGKMPPAHLTFLIDVSGSMNAPNKLPLIQKAFALLVKELRAEDKVAIVVYAGAAGQVLAPTPGDDKRRILDAIDNLRAGGSTATSTSASRTTRRSCG